jgi:ABC-type lipoprotein export system ATPase subunit
VLGPSGAGKSTLLRVIAGRSPSPGDAAAGLRLTSGAVTLDGGAPQHPHALARAVAMVPQEDNLLPFLTMLETAGPDKQQRSPRHGSRGAGRNPGASAYTQKRLSLDHPLSCFLVDSVRHVCHRIADPRALS